MPIKGLTKDTQAQVIRLGKLRKGAPKETNRPGRDLEYFRVTFEPEYEFLADAFAALYGDKPDRFENIWLLQPDIDDAFPTWLEQWQGAQLVNRCDGEYKVTHWDSQHNIMNTFKTACTCDPKDRACKQVGRLNVVLGDLMQETGIFGVFTVETHSVHDILSLYGCLETIKNVYGRIHGVPFTLGRSKKQITRPVTDKNGKPNGKRAKMTKSLLYLTIGEEFAKEEMVAILSGAKPAPALLSGDSDTEPVPAIDVETAKQLLTGSDKPRRVGAQSPTVVESVDVFEVAQIETEFLPPPDDKTPEIDRIIFYTEEGSIGWDVEYGETKTLALFEPAGLAGEAFRWTAEPGMVIRFKPPLKVYAPEDETGARTVQSIAAWEGQFETELPTYNRENNPLVDM